ncbi:MAG: LysR family transcriptional regulator [Alphaproteobacteria bacterium]|nr:MAG: LysR family transcriptional regulator [Alphaproteobacteria bacterium]
MDIRQLTYYTAIFEHKNLSHAASQCNVAQSAISHHLANLEKELGVTLFLRKPRGMEPTAVGIKLYEHARRILRAVHSAEQDIRKESERIEGDIAVGLPYSVMKAIGLPLMQAVLKDFPNVRLSIVESLSGSNFTSLLTSDVDVSLFYNPQKDERITMQAVLEEEVHCIGKPELLGEKGDTITFDDLCLLPVLLLRQGVSARAVIDRPGLLNRFEARMPVRLNSVNGIVTGLLAGLGCTLAPHVLVSEHLESGVLRARRVIDPVLTRHLYIGHLKDRPATRVTEAMTDLLLYLITEAVSAGRWQARLEF